MYKNLETELKINYLMDSHLLYSPHQLNSKHRLSTKKYHMETHRISRIMHKLLTKILSILRIILMPRVQIKRRIRRFSRHRVNTRSIKITQGQEKSSRDQFTNRIIVHTKKKRTIFPQILFSNVTSPTIRSKICPTLLTNPISRSDHQCIIHQNWTQKF